MTITKNTPINLSVADFVAFALFLLTLGISIGFYKTTIEDIKKSLDDLKSISTSIQGIYTTNATLNTKIENLKENHDKLYIQVQNLKK